MASDAKAHYDLRKAYTEEEAYQTIQLNLLI